MANSKQNTLQLFFLIILFGFGHVVWSQSADDDIKTKLNKTVGADRVDALNRLSEEIHYDDPKQGMHYAEAGIDLAQKVSYMEGEVRGYVNLGSIHRKLGAFNKAKDAYLIALQISTRYNYTHGKGEAYNGLGIVYNLLGDFDMATDAFFNSLKMCEQDGDIPGKAHALNNIGVVYWYAENLNKSLEYYIKALEIRKKIGDKNDIAASLNNIGNTYATLGENEKSLEYLLEALSIQQGIGGNEVLFALQINLGTVYANLDDQDKALQYFRKGMVIAKKREDSWGMAEVFDYMGLCYLNLKDYSKAESLFKQSLNLAEPIKAKTVLQQSYHNLSDLYLLKKEYKKSLEYYKLYSDVKDSIFNETSSKQMAELQTRYETEQKEAAINELTNAKEIQDLELKKSENLKLFFTIASILTLLLAVFGFYGYRQKRQANVLLQERNKLEVENKNRAINLFGQQVSKEVASELLSDSFNGESKKLFACVMFLDIRGFTPLVENKTPSEIIQFQNDVFGFMIDIISKHHGIINQFLGDGFMATFGAPASFGNDSQNAVTASMEIVETLRIKCESGELPETKIGIGLHSGHIVTGNVGTNERKQYSITGNTVILASRIEQLNKTYGSEILISKEVFENLDQNHWKTENLGAVKVKGRVEPMEIVRLI